MKFLLCGFVQFCISLISDISVKLLGKGKIPNIAVTYLEMLVKLENATAVRTSVSIYIIMRYQSGNTKGGSITVPLTSCLTGLESAL